MGQTGSSFAKKVAAPLHWWKGSSGESPNGGPACMSVTPFVFTRRGSMYFDEDGDLAHEFYEEVVVSKTRKRRRKMIQQKENLVPQGDVDLIIPRLHVDFPVILCEAPYSR